MLIVLKLIILILEEAVSHLIRREYLESWKGEWAVYSLAIESPREKCNPVYFILCDVSFINCSLICQSLTTSAKSCIDQEGAIRISGLLTALLCLRKLLANVCLLISTWQWNWLSTMIENTRLSVPCKITCFLWADRDHCLHDWRHLKIKPTGKLFLTSQTAVVNVILNTIV